MSKHTPGPWDEVKRINGRLYIGTKKKPIADICNLYGEESEANARLMAAAPDLYKALSELLPPRKEDEGWWCPCCKEIVPSTSVTYDECHEACGTYLGDVNSREWQEKAEAALAKAGGEE